MGTAIVPGIVALAVWGVVASTRRESVRAAGFYGAGLWEDLAALVGSVTGWLVPLAVESDLARGSVALVVGAVVVLIWVRAVRMRAVGVRAVRGSEEDSASREDPGSARHRLWRASALFAACYALTVLGARLFADHEIPFDARIFMPVFLVATLGTAVALASLVARPAAGRPSSVEMASSVEAPSSARERRRSWPAVAGALVAALWLGAAVWTNARGIPVMKDQGRFYTAWTWFTSDVVEWVEGPSREWSHLYSNEPWLLLFQTGRTPRLLPTENDVGDWSAFEAAYRERPGPVVVLYPLRPDDLTPDEIQARLGLRPELVRNEGVVLVPATDERPTPASTIRGATAQK